MKNEKIKAIFFDFDLTLADTSAIGKQVYAAFSKQSKVKPTKKGFSKFMGTRLSENMKLFAKTSKEAKKLYATCIGLHKKQLSKIKIYGKDIFDYLNNRKIKIIILSNTSNKIIKMICKHYNLHSDLIIGDEDIKKSWEKHQEMNYLIKKLKLKKSEVFYIGDHINDIREGKKAGIRVISVTTGVYSESQLKKYKPYQIISNLNELKQLI